MLAPLWTKAHYFGPSTCTTRALIAQVLAADMLAKGLTHMNMVLLYAWAGEAGCGGLQLKAVSASLLATHFMKVGLKLQGLVPIAFLHWPLHMYFRSLNILETVEMWLDA